MTFKRKHIDRTVSATSLSSSTSNTAPSLSCLIRPNPSLKVVHQLYPNDRKRLTQLEQALTLSNDRTCGMTNVLPMQKQRVQLEQQQQQKGLYNSVEATFGDEALSKGSNDAYTNYKGDTSFSSSLSYSYPSCEIGIRKNLRNLSDPLFNANSSSGANSSLGSMEDQLNKDDVLRAATYGCNVSNAKFETSHLSAVEPNLKHAKIRVSMNPNRLASGKIVKQSSSNSLSKSTQPTSVRNLRSVSSDYFISPSTPDESDEDEQNVSQDIEHAREKETSKSKLTILQEQALKDVNVEKKNSQSRFTYEPTVLLPNTTGLVAPSLGINSKEKIERNTTHALRTTLLPNTNNVFRSPIIEHQMCCSKDDAIFNNGEISYTLNMRLLTVPNELNTEKGNEVNDYKVDEVTIQ